MLPYLLKPPNIHTPVRLLFFIQKRSVKSFQFYHTSPVISIKERPILSEQATILIHVSQVASHPDRGKRSSDFL